MRANFANNCEHDGVHMTLVGQWRDMAAYYRGDDGSAWTFNLCTGRWSNSGSYAEFIQTFSTKHRGQLN